MSDWPKVSIIIPCYNEEKKIADCLDSIVANQYPKDKLEALVVDGFSTDRTREILNNYTARFPFIKMLDNPRRITPIAMNIGIKQAEGEIIYIVGSHSTVGNDFLFKTVTYLKEYDADCVGGRSVVSPSEDTLVASAISAAFLSSFGRGNATYMGTFDKPMYVDTVSRPCYKKEVFEKIGYFNEKLIRGQDLELNLRLKKAGGKILLVPDIVSYYYPKPSIVSFFKHNFNDGYWVTLPIKFGVKAFSFRHLVPAGFVAAFIGLAILSFLNPAGVWLLMLLAAVYLIASLYFSLKTAISKKNIKLFFLMPLAFACRHFGWGLGSLWGFLKLLDFSRPFNQASQP